MVQTEAENRALLIDGDMSASTLSALYHQSFTLTADAQGYPFLLHASYGLCRLKITPNRYRTPDLWGLKFLFCTGESWFSKTLGQFSQGQRPVSSGAGSAHCLTADNFTGPLVLKNMLSEIAL